MKYNHKINNLALILFLFTSFIFSLPCKAEIRSINTISSPKRQSSVTSKIPLDTGLKEAKAKLELRTVDLAQAGLTRLLQAWEKGENLDSLLADSFRDRLKLLDAVRIVNPGDARLRLLAIESTQVVSRSFVPASNGYVLTSRVAVRAKTQIEYTHAQNGFQKLVGVNEFILRVVQPLNPLP